MMFHYNYRLKLYYIFLHFGAIIFLIHQTTEFTPQYVFRSLSNLLPWEDETQQMDNFVLHSRPLFFLLKDERLHILFVE